LAQKHIIVSSRASGVSLEDFELSRIGLQRKVGLRCKHYFSACRVVENSTMLLTLPKSIATILVTRFDVDIYELPIHLPYIDLHLYWHKSATLDPANQWLRSLIINCSDKLLTHHQDIL
jgi:DNA-binding transcriptional LysR family regulator